MNKCFRFVLIMLVYSANVTDSIINRMKPKQGITYFGSEQLLKSTNPEFELHKSMFTLPTEDMHIYITKETLDLPQSHSDLEAVVIMISLNVTEQNYGIELNLDTMLNSTDLNNTVEVWILYNTVEYTKCKLVVNSSTFPSMKRLHFLNSVINELATIDLVVDITTSALQLFNIERFTRYSYGLCDNLNLNIDLTYLRMSKVYFNDLIDERGFTMSTVILEFKNLKYLEIDIDATYDFWESDWSFPWNVIHLEVLDVCVNFFDLYGATSVIKLIFETILFHQNIRFFAFSSLTLDIGSAYYMLPSFNVNVNLSIDRSFFSNATAQCEIFPKTIGLSCEQCNTTVTREDLGCLGGFRLPIAPNLREYHCDGCMSGIEEVFLTTFFIFPKLQNRTSDKPCFMNNTLKVWDTNYLRGIHLITSLMNQYIINTSLPIDGLDLLEEIRWNKFGECPPHLMAFIMNNPIPSIKTLSLRENGLSFPDNFELCLSLRSLQKVDFAKNEIITLPSKMFKDCRVLQFIDLSNNNIKVLPSMVRHHISQHHVTLDLSDNPLSCSCHPDAIQTIKWLQSPRHKHKNFEKYMCSNYRDMTKTHVVGIEISDHIDSCEQWSIIEIVIITVFSNFGLVVCIVSLLICRKYRYRLITVLYAIKQKCSKHQQQDFAFTLYLIYCREDRCWVHDILLDFLENTHGIRCCVHYRDFPGNGVLTEVIRRHMEESRYILAVLSESSINKTWPKFELKYARDLELRNDKKIFYIKLSDLGKQIPKEIQQVLDSRIFLEWPEDFKEKRNEFFDRLLAAIRGEELLGSCTCCFSSEIVTSYEHVEMPTVPVLSHNVINN